MVASTCAFGRRERTHRRKRLELHRSLTEGRVEDPECGSTWLTHRSLPAGQTEWPQMGDAPEAAAVDHQKLSTPNSAVGAIPRTIPGDAQHRLVKVVVDHTGQNMREVMRHTAYGQPRTKGNPGAVIVRMHVAGHGKGRDGVQARQIRRHAREPMACSGGGEIANVRPDEQPACAAPGQGALLLAAKREHRFAHIPAEERCRGVAARTTQDNFAPRHYPHHGIVDRPQNRPVVNEETIGYTAKLF